MPFTNGVFTRLRSWVQDAANGLPCRPDLVDQDTNDIAQALSLTLLRDGTGAPTADMPWAGRKITSLGAGAAPGDAVNVAQIDARFSFPGGFMQGGVAQTDSFGGCTVVLPKAFPGSLVTVSLTPFAGGTTSNCYVCQIISLAKDRFSLTMNLAPAAGGAVTQAPNTAFYWMVLGY